MLIPWRVFIRTVVTHGKVSVYLVDMLKVRANPIRKYVCLNSAHITKLTEVVRVSIGNDRDKTGKVIIALPIWLSLTLV